MQYVNNGMFALSLTERGVDTVDVDEDMETTVANLCEDNIDDVDIDRY